MSFGKGRRTDVRRPFLWSVDQRSGELLALGIDLLFLVFIFLTPASWLDAPVVSVRVAAGLSGTDDCPGGVFAGRVAVVSGG